MYDDDSLIFTEASQRGFDVVKDVLHQYCEWSGQVINFQKSSIVFSPNVSHQDKLQLSSSMDIPFSGRLGKYLGTWVDPGRDKSLVYQQVLNAIDSRTSSWKSKLLSQASRLALLKSVLAAVNIHILSCVKLPIYICEQIDSRCLDFFWGFNGSSKRMHLSNRDQLFLPENQGGLGIRPMELVNKSLLAKQVWRIISADQTSILAVTMGKKYIDWSNEQ